MFTFLFFLVSVVLPIILWAIYIRRRDSSEPEPGKFARKCFYLGAATLILAGFFEAKFYHFLNIPEELSAAGVEPLYLLGAFLAGPIEELFKYLILRYSVYLKPDFNQAFDGIVYGITIALGFSFLENVGYFFLIKESHTTGIFIFLVLFRAVFSTLTHVLSTGVMGLYVGRAKFATSGKNTLIIKGIIYASLIHGMFNVLVSTQLPYSLLIMVGGMITVAILFFKQWNKPEVRMVWKEIPQNPTPPLP